MELNERLLEQLKKEQIPTYSMSEDQLTRAIEILKSLADEMS